MSDTKVLTPEQIAELRAALAKATPGPWRTFAGVNDDGVWAACGPEHAADYDADETNEPGDVAEQAAQRDAELIALMRNALPSLLDAAERCARLSEAIPFTVKGFAGELPAIDILENVATQLTTATRERDEMARELERAREAMKKLHPRPSHGLLGDIGCVADRVGSNSDAWEELLRERDAAIARAEAAEKERDRMRPVVEAAVAEYRAADAANDETEPDDTQVQRNGRWAKAETTLHIAVHNYLNGDHAKAGK